MDDRNMTPREALYTICLELGPMPNTNRDDNITPKEARIRDAIRVLQEVIAVEISGEGIDQSN